MSPTGVKFDKRVRELMPSSTLTEREINACMKATVVFPTYSWYTPHEALTFSVRYAVRRNGPTDVDHAAAVRHLVLTRVFAGIVVINGMHNAQIQNQMVQNLSKEETH